MRATIGIIILFFSTAEKNPYGCVFSLGLILWGIHGRIGELKK